MAIETVLLCAVLPLSVLFDHGCDERSRFGFAAECTVTLAVAVLPTTWMSEIESVWSVSSSPFIASLSVAPSASQVLLYCFRIVGGEGIEKCLDCGPDALRVRFSTSRGRKHRETERARHSGPQSGFFHESPSEPPGEFAALVPSSGIGVHVLQWHTQLRHCQHLGQIMPPQNPHTSSRRSGSSYCRVGRGGGRPGGRRDSPALESKASTPRTAKTIITM